MFADLSLEEFCRRLADGQPTPGGGSASAMAGAMGAGLVSMFCSLTLGRKKYAEVQGEMEEAAALAQDWQAHLLNLVDLDSAAYGKVLEANRMPKDSAQEKAVRRQAIDAANLEATSTPLDTAASCVAVLERIPSLAAKGNGNALSDLKVGMELLYTAFVGAKANVDINLPWLPKSEAEEYREKIDALGARADKALHQGRGEISRVQA